MEQARRFRRVLWTGAGILAGLGAAGTVAALAAATPVAAALALAIADVAIVQSRGLTDRAHVVTFPMFVGSWVGAAAGAPLAAVSTVIVLGLVGVAGALAFTGFKGGE